jgi:DNA polymerase-3 subunit delta
VRSAVMGKEISEENLAPGYFFYGEEPYLAELFIRDVRDTLIPRESGEFNFERLSLDESKWVDIIDLARTIPIFFSPFRIIRVDIPDEEADFSAAETKLIKDYFSSPSARTVLVIICAEKLKKNHRLVKFFSSLGEGVIGVREIRPLKDKPLSEWIESRLQSSGKKMPEDAKSGLVELIGNDLRRLDNELEKLVLFVGERKTVEADDVNQVSAWIKAYPDWELADSLERGDIAGCLKVLDYLLDESTKPESILETMVRFFKTMYQAKLWLKDKTMDKKEIFRTLKPFISENYRDLYNRKFREFFFLVDGTSEEDMGRIFRELQGIDLGIKTTDTFERVLFERFVVNYCRERKRKGLILRAPD